MTVKVKFTVKRRSLSGALAVDEGWDDAMNGRMYFYQRLPTKKEPAQKLPDVIAEEVKTFTKIMGYRPEFAVIRLDEYVSGKYPVQVMKVTRSCPPSHFMLCPHLRREPVPKIEERKSCLK